MEMIGIEPISSICKTEALPNKLHSLGLIGFEPITNPL